MLPAELLIARRRSGTITPVYAELNNANIDFARSLIQLYSGHIGKKKHLLNQAVSEFEDLGHDYRFVRGLAVILDRRCQLKSKASVNPIDLRRKLFQTSSEKGIPTSEEERSIILSAVARELKIGENALLESIYGDLDDEMTINGFDSPDPVNLLKQYNLSLTQTLLFGAYELSFTATENWQQIFRRMKWLGLIYTINMNNTDNADNTDYWVKVDGPTSLFKLTKRYGTSLAKLLPAITESRYWRINAKIIDRSGGDRLLNLELGSLKHSQYMKQVALVVGEERHETFDSMVEADFAARFKALGIGWEIVREPGPLPVGKFVMIPDFLLKKDGLKVYLEVVGFWTPEYLEDKMKKLNLVRDVDMIVAVDRRLACQRSFKKIEGLNLFYFRGKIPLKPILVHLQDLEKYKVEREAQLLSGRELSLISPVMDAEDISEMLGISLGAVKRVMPQLHAAGYRKLGDMLIDEALFNAIKEALTKRLISQKLNFIEASKLIESMGGKNPSTVLEALGYQTIWHGINPEDTEIHEKQGSA